MTARRLCIAAVGVLLTACPEGGPPPLADAGVPVKAAAPRRASARLESSGGAVTLERDGKTGPAAPQDLFAKDAVETGPDGEAVLLFSGERRVELGPDGRFELDADGQGVVLNVVRGLVLTRVPHQGSPGGGGAPDVLLTITTPFGITRIGSSEVKFEVKQDSARVEVLVGEIELVKKDGAAVKLGAGKSARLGTVRELEPVELKVVVQGRAEYRAKGGKRFAPVNPRKLPVLSQGDSLRVLDGRVAVSPAGSATRLVLKGGAEVGVDRAARGDTEEDTQLEVRKGELEIAAPLGQRTRVGLGGGNTLVSETGGQFLVRRTAGGFNLASLAGDARLEREGAAPVELPAGGAAEVKGKGATVHQAQRDAVVLPTRTGLKLFHSGLRTASLGWEGQDGAPWRVQVATDAAFKELVLDGPVHQRFVTVPLPVRGALYWRVYEGARQHDQGSVQISREATSADLSRVKNEVIDGAEKTVIFFQDKPPTVNFTWKEEPGAAQYKLLVYRAEALGTPVAERTEKDRDASLPEGTLGEGSYLWSVTPLGPAGQELRGGRMNKLELHYDNAVPQLIIKSPRNGDPSARAVRVMGIAPVGARLFVNGKAAALDDKARFDTTAPPLPGGRMVFRLLNGGVEAYTVRVLGNGR